MSFQFLDCYSIIGNPLMETFLYENRHFSNYGSTPLPFTIFLGTSILYPSFSTLVKPYDLPTRKVVIENDRKRDRFAFRFFLKMIVSFFRKETKVF